MKTLKKTLEDIDNVKLLTKKQQKDIKASSSGISYYYRECAYYINGPVFCSFRGKRFHSHSYGSSYGCFYGGRDQEIACY
ncbi:hypothetical protein GCM10009430_31950 [Aquimarina litoralis]|uniref:Uncharacterized protein n=1 Tax=Aquimarina litoralis TaxID=584605 RepID=A0ABN1J1G1_9FLAO